MYKTKCDHLLQIITDSVDVLYKYLTMFAWLYFFTIYFYFLCLAFSLFIVIFIYVCMIVTFIAMCMQVESELLKLRRKFDQSEGGRGALIEQVVATVMAG